MPGPAKGHSKHSSSPPSSYGRNGFLVSPTVAHNGAQVPLFASQPDSMRSCPRTSAGNPVSCFCLSDHAATLEKIAATNGEEFYWAAAAKLSRRTRRQTAVMRADDCRPSRGLGRHDHGTYWHIHQIPPNGQSWP